MNTRVSTPSTTPAATGALVPADPPGVFVATRYGDVHVVVDGDPSDPAVVCTHGIPGSTRDFRYLGPACAQRGLCVVRVDLPGFGRSADNPNWLFGAVARAQLLADVAAARGHTRFAVVGHSYGGTAAIATAASHAPHVSALVLVNSIGIHRHRGLVVPHELTGIAGRAMHWPVVGTRMSAALAGIYAKNKLKSDVPLNDERMSGHAQMVGGIDFADQRAFVRRVVAPTMIVSAGDDPLIQSDVPFALADALRAAPLVSHLHVARGGHWLQKQEAHAIAQWLADRLRPHAPA